MNRHNRLKYKSMARRGRELYISGHQFDDDPDDFLQMEIAKHSAPHFDRVRVFIHITNEDRVQRILSRVTAAIKMKWPTATLEIIIKQAAKRKE